MTGREDGGFLCFRVEDTGRGMTHDQLRDVRARMRGELPPAYAPYANAGTGFGLNIDQSVFREIASGEGSGKSKRLETPVPSLQTA